MLNEEFDEILIPLVGKPLCAVFKQLCDKINALYDMEGLWTYQGKKWTYEYKFRRGGKTLCCIYVKQNCVGFMIIFGKVEREKFEANQNEYAKEIQITYQETKTFHDGKWMMFTPIDASLFDDFMKLLAIKRRPNKKISIDGVSKSD